ncbi:MAG TPA: MoxR family ATPase [Hyphomicrobiales bacterium]|nr:MoxR family ATPase [Hyphomicrobiales bacterium]
MTEAVAQQQGTDDTRELVQRFQEATGKIRDQVRGTIVGQNEVVDSLLITLFVGGHCLITGMPGTAKTLLVHTLASALGLTFKRIQFTPDLMPTDITGTDMVEEDQSTGKREWRFIPGPVFTNVLLADEINRTPPKTQAALLEAMQEKTVTVRGKNHVIDKPFFVLATQNPIELEGTYPLPEAQLDRFLFNVMLDYLSAEEEVKVIERFTQRVDMPEVLPCTNAAEIVKFQALVRQVPVANHLNRYAVDIVRATRPSDPIAPDIIRKYANFGSSIRATMNLVLAAKARALMEGRYHVTAEDLKSLALPILRHRVLPNYYAESDGVTVDHILRGMLDAVPVPAGE